jgi:hypothetical protein
MGIHPAPPFRRQKRLAGRPQSWRPKERDCPERVEQSRGNRG